MSLIISLFSSPVLTAQTPTLVGSPESQDCQNEEASKEGLLKILNNMQLKCMIRAGTLVKLPVNKNLTIDRRLPARFRYCLPQTKKWLLATAKPHEVDGVMVSFGKIKITSAVRTEEYQRQLRKRNPNAIERSSHVFGCTVDIAKKGHTAAQLNAMRRYLLMLKGTGVIESIEEHNQACFHVMVFRKYIETRNIPHA